MKAAQQERLFFFLEWARGAAGGPGCQGMAANCGSQSWQDMHAIVAPRRQTAAKTCHQMSRNASGSRQLLLCSNTQLHRTAKQEFPGTRLSQQSSPTIAHSSCLCQLRDYKPLRFATQATKLVVVLLLCSFPMPFCHPHPLFDWPCQFTPQLCIPPCRSKPMPYRANQAASSSDSVGCIGDVIWHVNVEPKTPIPCHHQQG